MDKLDHLITQYNQTPTTHTLTKIVKCIEKNWNIKITDIQQVCETCKQHDRIDLMILLVTYYPNHVKTTNEKQHAIETLKNHVDIMYNYVCVKHRDECKNRILLNVFIEHVPFNPWRSIAGFIDRQTYEQYIQVIKHIIDDRHITTRLNDTSYTLNKLDKTMTVILSNTTLKLYNIHNICHVMYEIIKRESVTRVNVIASLDFPSRQMFEKVLDNYNLHQLCEVTFHSVVWTFDQTITKLIEINPEFVLYDNIVDCSINFYLSQYKIGNTQIVINRLDTDYGIGTITHVIVPDTVCDVHCPITIHKRLNILRQHQPIYNISNNTESHIKRIGFTTKYHELASRDEYITMIVDLINRLEENNVLYKIVLVTDESPNDTLYTKLIKHGKLKICQLRYFEIYYVEREREHEYEHALNNLLTCDVLIDNTHDYEMNDIVNELLMYGRLIFTYGNVNKVNQMLRNVQCEYIIHSTFMNMNMNIVKLLKNDKIKMILQSHVYNKLLTHKITNVYNYELWSVKDEIHKLLISPSNVKVKYVIFVNMSGNDVYDLLIRLVCVDCGIKFCENVECIDKYMYDIMGFENNTVLIGVCVGVDVSRSKLDTYTERYPNARFCQIEGKLTVRNFTKCEITEEQKKHITWNSNT